MKGLLNTWIRLIGQILNISINNKMVVKLQYIFFRLQLAFLHEIRLGTHTLDSLFMKHYENSGIWCFCFQIGVCYKNKFPGTRSKSCSNVEGMYHWVNLFFTNQNENMESSIVYAACFIIDKRFSKFFKSGLWKPWKTFLLVINIVSSKLIQDRNIWTKPS